ncbi:MAG: hypothetical protein BWY71_02383 [Planctomycetes bacterium ADurb.Bin412]|nr:MAG: hypothetical protein BWY71_02383 [Planctomycetes bacterium ADurb.Bin412]
MEPLRPFRQQSPLLLRRKIRQVIRSRVGLRGFEQAVMLMVRVNMKLHILAAVQKVPADRFGLAGMA